MGSRGGYEYFEETNTQLFFLAQWFPRLAARDYGGWENKAFWGAENSPWSLATMS